jgi:hypothetical protein
VSSLPFLSTFVRWTTFARLDFGIVAVLRDVSGEFLSTEDLRIFFNSRRPD